MTKIVAIIGGMLLMAGVAYAGTASTLGSSGEPTIGSTLPTVASTVRQEDRGREREARGRANEAGEDVRREDRRVRVADDRGHGGHGGDD